MEIVSCVFFFFCLLLEGIIRRLSIFSSIPRTVCLRSRSRELQGMAIGEKMEKGGKLCPNQRDVWDEIHLGILARKRSCREKDKMGDASI